MGICDIQICLDLVCCAVQAGSILHKQMVCVALNWGVCVCVLRLMQNYHFYKPSYKV